MPYIMFSFPQKRPNLCPLFHASRSGDLFLMRYGTLFFLLMEEDAKNDVGGQ